MTPIEPVEDNEDNFVDEESAYNFRQLMDMLIENKDVIVTVPTEQITMLRAGFIMRKSKDNRIAVHKGLLPNDEVLSFDVYPARDKATKQDIPGQMCLRAKLRPRKSVTVLNIEVPDNGF